MNIAIENKKLLRIVILILIFTAIFVVYYNCPVVVSYDSKWVVPTSLSLINEHNTDLNEYSLLLKEREYFQVENIDGKYYSKFPVGTSVIIVPLVYIFDKIYFLRESSKETNTLYEAMKLKRKLYFIEKVVSSIIACIACLVIYLLGRERLAFFESLLLVFVFAFCTSNWSTSSRALWQHGISTIFLTLALLMVIKAERKSSIIAYSSLFLALAFLVRPTNAIPVMIITIFVSINYRKHLLKYILFSVPFIMCYFGYNYIVCGTFLTNYYQPDRIFHFGTFIDGFVGNLISPSRGLFIFSPIFLLAFSGFFSIPNRYSIKSIYLYLPIIIFLHLCVISMFPYWWGGHSYGPRFFTDMLPFFMFFLIYAVLYTKKQKGLSKRLMIYAFIILTSFSFYTHYKGACSMRSQKWNIRPVNVDDNTYRLWLWQDAQFLS